MKRAIYKACFRPWNKLLCVAHETEQRACHYMSKLHIVLVDINNDQCKYLNHSKQAALTQRLAPEMSDIRNHYSAV
jgi:hypothetical protein